MLRSLKDLERYKVSATDGDIGHVANFLFDDVGWGVRYLVVDTGGFLGGLRVLITPVAFREADYSAKRFRLALTIDKVKNSPSVDVDLPVSRQYEKEYSGYYGYPYYWADLGLSGHERYSGGTTPGVSEPVPDRPAEAAGDAHLRSAKDVTGYHIEAIDGSVGHIKDFLVDDETWEIRYLVIATTDWWPGKSVLIAPRWATRINWRDRAVQVGMNRDAIKNSPEWSPTRPVAAAYEDELYRHYAGIPGWRARDRGLATKDLDDNARVARHEEEQVRAADTAAVRDSREGRMP